MPIKKGGYDQLYALQALAGRRQVILAIGTHDNTGDTAALHPLLQAGTANLAAAGIPATIGKALFGAGYASEDKFTTPCDAERTSPSPANPARPASCTTARPRPAARSAGRR